MLELKNVNITLKENGRTLIKDLNFTLCRGDKAVIIGEEGDGKSTLIKYIYDKSLIEGYCSFTGQVIHPGLKLGFLQQEISPEWMDRTVEEFFSDTDIYGSSGYDIWQLNFDSSLLESKQRISTLSGGEKVKIRVARLLAQNPDILLMDEPTNDLDLQALEWLERFINECRIPILFVSHDETLIERTANVIIHLEQLKRKEIPRHTIVRMGYEEYIAARASMFAKQEQIASKQREEYRKKIERWHQIYSKVEHQQDTITRADPGGARLLKKKIKSLKSQKERMEKAAEDFVDFPSYELPVLMDFSEDVSLPRGKKVLEFYLDKLTVDSETANSREEESRQEDGARILARNIRLTVTGNEHVVIIGANGTGKTTLIRKIKDVLLPRKDIKVGYMPQDYDEVLDYSITPIEYLAGSGTKEDTTRAYNYLGCLRFTYDEMNNKTGNLSSGQKAKLILLRMILEECNVLILDEPTRNLSPLSTPVIRGILSRFKGAIISTSHDRKYINGVSTVIYELRKDGLHKI